MKVLLAALLAVTLAVAARGQGCPITSSDVSKLDFSSVKTSCAGLSNPPSTTACDTCAAALFTAFEPTFSKFGASCATLTSNPNAAANAVTQAITPCVNVVLPALMQAGVPVNNLVILRSCPTTPGPALTAAIDKVCPNYSVQASSSG